MRAELEAEVLAEALRVGADRVRRSDIVEEFIGRGIPRATGFQWIREYFESGRLGQAMARKIRTSADLRAADRGLSATDLVTEDASRAMPATPSVVSAFAATSSPVDIIGELASVIADVKAVRQAAFGADGKPRNMRLVLSAAEAMRRNLETAARLQEAMHDLARLERFNAAIIEEIAKESPDLAQRVVVRLQAIATTWGG